MTSSRSNAWPMAAVVEGEGWRLTALHTPGHCANHLCFALEEQGILFGGDHAMSCSTSVVIPPDGDMADYMAALARIAARDWALLLPGHGAPLAEPGPLLHALLAHRREREQLVLGALRQHGPARLEVLVPAVYGPIDPRLVRAAGHSLLAHLRKLAAEGAASRAAGPLAWVTGLLSPGAEWGAAAQAGLARRGRGGSIPVPPRIGYAGCRKGRA
jgi:glyoxylase-like metal-dependent hydrolase (beta-lactamase superfamily II)